MHLHSSVYLSTRPFAQCDAVNGLSVTETWTLRASLLTYIMALTATIGMLPPHLCASKLRLQLRRRPQGISRPTWSMTLPPMQWCQFLRAIESG